MAAALASGSCSFLGKKSSFFIEEINGRNYDTRIPFSIFCQSRESVNHHFNPKIKKEVQEERVFLQQILQSVQKMGKGIKDSLSPKQKGDWKDLTLMCLSFAVYVYISQKLVCAYCAWISILDQAM